jgi:hypothetical protein
VFIWFESPESLLYFGNEILIFMKTAPHSFEEASKLCNEFQYLLGQSFGDGSNNAISCVAISPFDQMNKKRFIMYYLLFNDAEMALQQDYKGLLFDVMVISVSTDGQQMLHEDLHTWLCKNRTLYASGDQVFGQVSESVAQARFNSLKKVLPLHAPIEN